MNSSRTSKVLTTPVSIMKVAPTPLRLTSSLQVPRPALATIGNVQLSSVDFGVIVDHAQALLKVCVACIDMCCS